MKFSNIQHYYESNTLRLLVIMLDIAEFHYIPLICTLFKYKLDVSRHERLTVVFYKRSYRIYSNNRPTSNSRTSKARNK